MANLTHQEWQLFSLASNLPISNKAAMKKIAPKHLMQYKLLW